MGCRYAHPRTHARTHARWMCVQTRVQRCCCTRIRCTRAVLVAAPAPARPRVQERFRVEVENAKSHRAKVEAAWMHLLRMATVSSLRADVETLAAQHERDCAYRDATLRMMFDDLMAAEEQYRVALFSHLQQMDRLIELQVRTAASCVQPCTHVRLAACAFMRA
ncbi:hypothetical protein EON67_03140 [archaeon]|nr:MAG: hypothetical protein EON67_03140 [archaeon]